MKAAYMIGLLPRGEAFYTDSALPLEEQKKDALEWLHRDHGLHKVLAVVGSEVTDITAAYCRMWMSRSDLSDYGEERDFPPVVMELTPELVAEVMQERAENERGRRDLIRDYHASLL